MGCFSASYSDELGQRNGDVGHTRGRDVTSSMALPRAHLAQLCAWKASVIDRSDKHVIGCLLAHVWS